MVQLDIDRLWRWPFANMCSDGALQGAHPRGFGAFPRFFRMAVRERHLLSLEEAGPSDDVTRGRKRRHYEPWSNRSRDVCGSRAARHRCILGPGHSQGTAPHTDSRNRQICSRYLLSFFIFL
jgi:hypothetical protein